MTTRTDLFQRMIESSGHHFSAEHARYILSLDFSKREHARYQKLAAKAQAGKLTKAEGEELDEFLTVNSMLTVLQSKARVALRKHTSAA
jgi:hypothetical protein